MPWIPIWGFYPAFLLVRPTASQPYCPFWLNSAAHIETNKVCVCKCIRFSVCVCVCCWAICLVVLCFIICFCLQWVLLVLHHWPSSFVCALSRSLTCSPFLSLLFICSHALLHFLCRYVYIYVCVCACGLLAMFAFSFSLHFYFVLTSLPRRLFLTQPLYLLLAVLCSAIVFAFFIFLLPSWCCCRLLAQARLCGFSLLCSTYIHTYHSPNYYYYCNYCAIVPLYCSQHAPVLEKHAQLNNFPSFLKLHIHILAQHMYL